MILTDSVYAERGFSSKVPCVTLRSETEWTELLPGGHNRLAYPLIDSISRKATEAMAASLDWTIDLYGNGCSSELIASSILKFAK